jgi:hypothetical protein
MKELVMPRGREPTVFSEIEHNVPACPHSLRRPSDGGIGERRTYTLKRNSTTSPSAIT